MYFCGVWLQFICLHSGHCMSKSQVRFISLCDIYKLHGKSKFFKKLIGNFGVSCCFACGDLIADHYNFFKLIPVYSVHSSDDFTL